MKNPPHQSQCHIAALAAIIFYHQIFKALRLRNGNPDNLNRFRRKIRPALPVRTAVGARTVKSGVAHQGSGRIERQPPGQKRRSVPPHRPGVDPPQRLIFQHPVIRKCTVKIKLTAAAAVETGEQFQAVRFKIMPGTAPCSPPPAIRSAQKHCLPANRTVNRRESVYLHNLRIILIEFQRFKHITQKIRRYFKIILQHHHPVALRQCPVNSTDYRTCQTAVMFLFNNIHTGKTGNRVQIFPHLRNPSNIRLCRRSILIDVKSELRGLRITQKRLHTPPDMIRPFIGK